MFNPTRTPIEIEADKFFEWDGPKTPYVTLTSAIMFAEHYAALQRPAGEWRKIEYEDWFKELVILGEVWPSGEITPIGIGKSRKVFWGDGKDENETQHDLFVSGRFITPDNEATHYLPLLLPPAPTGERK